LEGDVCLCFWVAGAVNESSVSNDCLFVIAVVGVAGVFGVAHVCHRSSLENGGLR